MADLAADADPCRANRLLAALADDEYAALRPHLTAVDLAAGATIYRAGARIRHAYFPLTGVASVLAATADGGQVEVGSIGREGLVGLPALWREGLVGLPALYGTDGGPLGTIAQVPGAFARLPVAALRAAAAPGTDLYRLLTRFNEALYRLAAQSGACNRLHPLAARCAHWLLLTHDRVGRATFALPPAYLGYMVGTRHPGVTGALGTLQAAGLIADHRGAIVVTDRAGLEQAACACYRTITAEYDRIVGPDPDAR